MWHRQNTRSRNDSFQCSASRWKHPTNHSELPSNVEIVDSRGNALLEAVKPATTFGRRPGRRGHKHSPNSSWWTKRRLYHEAQDELKEVLDSAHRDRDLAEVVATRESNLLNIEEGEVLRQSVKYQRTFHDVFNR